MEGQKTVKYFKYGEHETNSYLNWAFIEVLPRYKQYLDNSKMHNKDEAFAVVKEFCDVCAGMGFFDFRRLPTDLLTEYPVMVEESKDPQNKISKEFVAKYLKDFFAFLETYYGIEQATPFRI
ncbi:MAG: hypothetical protein NTZ44_02290 [Candidatus Nomurabacteria bacterium]|nr:hypothetical protein [Candidatus Nomurabacteria bacterium]